MTSGSAGVNEGHEKGQHYHAFLSHNGADKPLVEELANQLEQRGLRCWLDKWNLIPGDPWQPAIEDALGRCDTCVVFFGPHGLGPWHNEEMRLALQRRVSSMERKLRILPVILPLCQRPKESDVPGFLQGTTWVEFRQSIDEADALHRLLCGIRGIPPGHGPGQSDAAGECPYIGLKTFQPDDAPLFFGRTAKIQEVVDRLRSNFGNLREARFIALIGTSGSGKSSLALAGLVPAVQRGELPGSADWLLVRCRPGARPWENLQIALAANPKIAQHLSALSGIITRPEDEQRRLHIIAQITLHGQPETQRLFVLIDQFEEIFTLCNDEAARRELIDNVLYATSVAQGRTIVVLTVRADFYGQCANYPGLRAAVSDSQSLIGPLSEQELREAIESPAQLAGGELEPGLTELLLADMRGQAGALPFLEHALFKLWEKRDGRRLTAKAYIEMGRLQGALDAHAEEFFTNILSTGEQGVCRQVLVDLVHPGEGTADTKKRVSLDDVAPTSAARAVLEKLADARLVTTGRDYGPETPQVELAHEALISGWHRLGEWVNENREKSRLKERLVDSAREWQRNQKREDFLYRGVQLAAAEESFRSSRESLPKLGREFLEASISTRDHDRQERQREQRNRQRLMATAMAVFALLTVAAGAAAIFGFWQKGEAEKEARVAIEAERRAKEQADLAQVAKEQASEQASEANVSLARYSRQSGNDAQALEHLALALRLNQRNYGASAFAGSMLTQTRWPVLVASLIRHQGPVFTAHFSADGQRVVTASEDGTARIWDAATGKPIGEPMKHTNWVKSAQFSRDGQRVATASWDGTARLWDATTGKGIGEPLKHGGLVESAQFSPDGQRVATASWSNGAVRLWDAATGKAIGETIQGSSDVFSSFSIEFSPDGKLLVTASSDGTAQLWDVTTGDRIGQPVKHESRINTVQFSPDGQRVVTASTDGTARIWDAASQKGMGEPMEHRGAVLSARFSPDGQRVVTCSSDGTARLWDGVTGKALTPPMQHQGAVKSAQFSPDGQRVVTASDDGTARLWNVRTGEEIGEPMNHEREVNSAEFSPDGQQVVTASNDGTVRFWNTLDLERLEEPMKHEGAVFSANFSPDGQRVVTASEDNTAQLWDAATGQRIGEPMEHTDELTSAQFSPDGRLIVTASEDGTARLWDGLSGKATGLPMKHSDWVTSALFSPDGKRIVTASDDDTARLWDALTGNAVGQPMRHEKGVGSARFSPDGQRLVTTSADGTVRLWDATNGKELTQPMKPEDPPDFAEFSPDGREIVTASFGSAQLWDAVIGRAINQPMKHGGQVECARFSPDGRRVVTASLDKTARLWDTATGNPIGEPMKHYGNVNFAQFSPDGKRVATVSSDNTARLWDATTGKEIGVAMKHGGPVNSADFSPDGQRVLTASYDDTARLWDAPTVTGKDTTEDLLLLADLAEATGGVSIKRTGQTDIRNTLTPDQVRATRERIGARFAGVSLTPLQQCMKWCVSDPKNRTISPFSKRTVGEWIENRIKEGIVDDLRAAMRVDPINARVAAHLGKALAEHGLDKKRAPTKPDETRGKLTSKRDER